MVISDMEIELELEPIDIVICGLKMHRPDFVRNILD